MDFNPQFSTPDVSYLKYSKSSPQPESDKSLGMDIQAVGSGLEGALEVTDAAFKKGITNEISTRTDAAKTDFLNQLSQFQQKNGTQSSNPTGNPLNANASADTDVTASNTPDVPDDVQKGLDTIQSIANAKSQSKFRSTNLDANLTDMLKDLRTRYPGYRDYIDEKGSSIIGYNPANKLITDKVAELNEQRTNVAKEQDFWEKKLVDSGYTGSQEVLAQFKQDHNIARVQSYLTQNNIAHQGIADAKSKFELSDKIKGDRQSTAENLAYKIATEAATDNFRNRKFIQNDPTSATSEQIQDTLNDLAMHPEKVDPNAVRNLGMQLQALESYNTQRTRMSLMQATVTDATGARTSAYEVLGPKRVGEIINEQISTLYGVMHKQLADQQFGLVNATQNAAVDIGSSEALKVLNDPSTRQITRTGMVLNKLIPNLSPELVKDVWGGDLVKNPAGGPSKITTEMLRLSGVQKQQGVAQTGGNVAGPGDQGNVYTFNQAMTEQDKAQVQTRSSDADRAAAITDVLKLKRGLTEKDPATRDHAISFFFDPSNQTTISKWLKEDYYDPQRGVVRGGTTTLGELTSDEVSKGVWDRAHNGNGLAWDNYKNWSNRQIVPALTTIAKTWNVNESQLKSQQTLHGAEGDIPSGTDHHFYYDSDNHKIGVTDLKGNPIDENAWTAKPDLFAVRNANIMLKSLAGIAKTEGTDENAYIFRALHQAGWAPESIDIKGKSTVSDRIVRAVITSANPPKKEEK